MDELKEKVNYTWFCCDDEALLLSSTFGKGMGHVVCISTPSLITLIWSCGSVLFNTFVRRNELPMSESFLNLEKNIQEYNYKDKKKK